MAASIAQVLGQLHCWTSDAVLLERFIHQRDEAAFAALVARHGAMVLRLCRRILGDVHEAEDAFQAAFLILARKAHSLKQPDALAAWLYGVARRVALKARGQSNRRRSSTAPLDEALPDPRPDPLARLNARELLDILDEEVRRLPAEQRSVFVLCCLEGRTQEEAARMLGWTAGSVKGRLERGRQRLQTRLTRRGIALSAALALVTMSHGIAVSASLRSSAVRAALGGGIGTPAAALAASVLKAMLLPKLAGVMALVMTAALAASTTVALVYRSSTTEAPEDKTPAPPAAAKVADVSKPQARKDALGDPLPPGAIARLGTVRFRPGDATKHLTFTPDGKRLVTWGGGGVSVWDVITGKELHHLAYERGRDLGNGDLSPDGKLVAVWGREPQKFNDLCTIELWDVQSGKKVGSLEAKCNVSPVYHQPIRFSPDGKLLAASSTDVHIWDLASGKKLRSWQAHRDSLWSMTFAPDSRQLITCDSTGEFRLWDAMTGRQLQKFKPLEWKGISTELETAFAPDGKLLALNESIENHVAADGKIEWKARISLRDTATGKQVRLLVCPGYDIVPWSPRSFRALTFTSDGKGLITAGPDHFVRVWDSNTGKEQRRLPLEELPDSLALSRDGKKLAVMIYGGKAIRIVDMNPWQTMGPPGGHLMEVSLAVLAPDGRTAVTGSPFGSLSVWDAASGRMRRRLQGHDGSVMMMRLGSDGRTLFTLGWDETLRVWDLTDATERRRITVENDLGRLQRTRLPLTPDGKTLAVITRNHTIRLLDAATGKERQSFQGPEEVWGMGLTPDGRSLIAWSGDFKIRVWDTATGRKLREYPLPRGHNGSSAALSPDGRLLAMECNPSDRKQECLLILMDLATGQVIQRIDKSSPDFSLLISFSPDGRMLAWTGFKDLSIRLLEVASGRERRRLVGHRGRIDSLVAFSADGRRLLSGSSDTTALVWDLARISPPPPAKAADMEPLWNDLAGTDAARAYQAIHRLATSSSSVVSFMRKRLRPIPLVDEKRLTRLIADLDSDDFAVRQKASEELAKLGELALPAYRKALEGKPSLESRRRLDVLLDQAQRAWWDVSGERLRSLRAIEALELAGTKEAREVLETLAAGAAGARLTEQAKAALQRLARRGRN